MDENNSRLKPQKSQNVTWRPIETIRPKVIALAKQQDRLLVCEVLNDHGELKGWCPPGGGIEFGESIENALRREIFEELGCGILTLESPKIYDNIFEHHGVKGHEIILAFPVTFDDPEIYKKQRFQIYESRGSIHWAEWIEIERFRSGQERLFPQDILT